MENKLKNLLNKSLYVHKEILDDEENGALYRWNHKTVYDKVLLYNGDSLENITACSCVNLSLSNEVSDNSLNKIISGCWCCSSFTFEIIVSLFFVQLPSVVWIFAVATRI